MDTTDICDMDEFKDEPMCSKEARAAAQKPKGSARSHTFWENVFWVVFLVLVAFFSSTWLMFIDRILDRLFGNTRSTPIVAALAALSLVLILIFAHFFDIDLEY